MRILYLWGKDYPWDVRTEKICLALHHQGHDVHLTARNLRRRPELERVDGLVVHRLAPRTSHALNELLSFPFFASPLWNGLIQRVVAEERIELIIVRDLPLALSGLKAARRFGLPAVLDMAEDYVAMLWDIWRYKRVLGPNLVVRNPLLARIVERAALPKFDHVLIVTEEARQVVARAGADPERTTVVGNTPSLALAHRAPKPPPEAELLRQRFCLVYTGSITNMRGLDTVLAALPAIAERVPEVLCVVIGSGYAATRFKDEVRRRGLEGLVHAPGWVDHDRLYDYLSLCRVGIIPHYVTPHVETTLPNKLFDYMLCGLAVAATEAAPLKRIVAECGCGQTFRSADPADCARAVIELSRDPQRYGQHGREAVLKRYNWEEDEKRLAAVIESLAASRGAARR